MSSSYRPNRRDVLKHGAAASAVAMGIAHLPALRGAAGAQLARNETLFIGGHQWGPPTTFNPLAPTIAWPANAMFPFLWEQLFAFNMMTGEIEPLLAESLEWNEDFTEATVVLREGTAFHDGTPLTSADVVYTYNLPAKEPGVPFAALTQYISAIEAVDERTVKFVCQAEVNHPGMVSVYLQQVPILPMHIWEAREAEGLTGIVDMEPIGSGPFKVNTASAEQVIIERVDTYWGNEVHGAPAPKYVVHPIAKSNDDTNLAFQRGDIDLSQTFAPQLWKMWEEQDLPVGTWYKEEPYHVPGNIPMLIPNINKPGLDNPKVRLALAYSINYAQIAETAMSRYSIPVNPSLIVPVGAEEKFFNAESAATGWGFDLEKARAILEDELGATKGDDGIYTLEDGTRLGPWTVRCPYGWTDWMTALELVVQGGREAGFDVQTEFPEAPIVTTAMQQGDFDITMYSMTGVSAAGPWQRMRDIFDNRGVPAIGETAFYNYNRYANADAEAILDQIPHADEATQIELYGQLDDMYRADLPVIGLMYRPLQFFEYNETNWQGFPNSENPYAPPMHTGAGIKIYSNIKPVE